MNKDNSFAFDWEKVIKEGTEIVNGYLKALDEFVSTGGEHQKETNIKTETNPDGKEYRVVDNSNRSLKMVSIYEDKDTIAEKLGIENPDSLVIANVQHDMTGIYYDVFLDSSVDTDTVNANIISSNETACIHRENLNESVTEVLYKELKGLLNQRDIMNVVYGDWISNRVLAWNSEEEIAIKTEFKELVKNIEALKTTIELLYSK